VNSGAATSTALTTTGRIGVNQATPGVDLDVVGTARVNSGSASGTALTTTGWVGVNKATPTVALDVAGAAKFTGNLDMTSYRINNLLDPSSTQDAATKSYVDTATAGIATTSAVTTAITNALGSSGSMNNAPTIFRHDTLSNTLYLTGTADVALPGNLGFGRAGLYVDSNLSYNPSNNTLTAGVFSGAISGTTGTFSSTILAYGSTTYSMSGNGRYWDKDGTTGTNVTTSPLSIIADNPIWTKGSQIWVTSDQRIKTNIVNLNTDKMMTILRNLRPVSFDFIDHFKNGNKKKLGFIAQEINEILPEGISLNTDVIPNNMMKCEIDLTSKIEASFTLKPDDTDITLQYLLLTTDSPLKFDTANPYSSTNVYKFKVYCGDKWAKEQDIYIRSEYNVIDDKYTYVIGMKKETYDIMITEPTLFVYGQYVYDLHILDHDTIYTVATAALQEVDRQQQADKVRIAELEATVANQQSLINDILERLKKVGA
jgi:hypothetical protein